LKSGRIKVAVDARLLSLSPLTGIGRYTLEMCNVLRKMDRVSLFLYSPSPILSLYSSSLEGAVFRVKNLNSMLLRRLWYETYLPWRVKRDNMDVFWGPIHHLPVWLPQQVASVVTIHDLVWKFFPETMRPLSRVLERIQMPLAVSRADHVVADSQATAQAVIEEFKASAERLSVITLGVSKFKPPQNIGALSKLNIHSPYFLFVGTLEPRKNLVNLLLSYSQLPPALKKRAMLVIAGGRGWGNVRLKELISSLQLAEHVILTGYVDDKMLATLYANALFLAMPSLYEGFGLPLVEAMSYGKAVLTSNKASMPEVAGDAGLFVDPYDPESITQGLQQIISDQGLRDKLAANAKTNAARFDWDESARKLVGVFEKSIAARISRQGDVAAL